MAIFSCCTGEQDEEFRIRTERKIPLWVKIKARLSRIVGKKTRRRVVNSTGVPAARDQQKLTDVVDRGWTPELVQKIKYQMLVQEAQERKKFLEANKDLVDYFQSAYIIEYFKPKKAVISGATNKIKSAAKDDGVQDGEWDAAQCDKVLRYCEDAKTFHSYLTFTFL